MHLEETIDTVKGQLDIPGVSQLQLHLSPVKLCVPYLPGDNTKHFGQKQLRFPGNTEAEAARFVVMLRLCVMVLGCLKDQRYVTSRDLYYKDVALFKSQKTVVTNLDRLVQSFRVPRHALNMVASPHGLMAATLTISLEGGEVVDSRRSNGATLIPVGRINYVSAQQRPKFILVVEKEAVFTHLQEELPAGIIVTGKGFPDRATRNLLQALTVTYPEVPMYVLVDSDPHGVLILRNYETGSAKTFEPQFHLNLMYIGVSILEYTEGLVPQTVNDMKVGVSTLKKDWIYESKYEPCKQELQRGLFMSLKGEMNLIDSDQSHRLANYVQKKMEVLGGLLARNTNWNESKLVVHDVALRRYVPHAKRRKLSAKTTSNSSSSTRI